MFFPYDDEGMSPATRANLDRVMGPWPFLGAWLLESAAMGAGFYALIAYEPAPDVVRTLIAVVWSIGWSDIQRRAVGRMRSISDALKAGRASSPHHVDATSAEHIH